MSDDRTERLRADRRLLTRYHRDGDRAARAELVERFLPLARQLARRYEGECASRWTTSCRSPRSGC